MKASPQFLQAATAFLLAALSLPSEVSAKDSGTWIKSSLTTSPHSNYYGVTCSLSSRLLAVGAPYETPNEQGEDAGTAHILYREDNGELTLGKEITGDEFDQLGESVAVSKGVNSGGRSMEVVVVGSPRHSTKDGKMNIGMARVFYYSDFHSEWQQLGQDIVGKWDEEFFGQTVAISDDGMMVAVATSVGDAARRGRVELYHYSDVANSWEMMGYPLEGKAEGAKFGTSVSISQVDTFDSGAEKYYVAIGAPQVNKGRGIVQVYHWDQDLGDWSQVGRDVEGDEAQDQLGYDVSIAMSGAHLYLAIGIPSAVYYGGNEGESDSRVQVYKYNTDLDGKTEWIYFGDEIEQFEDGDGTGEVVALSQDGMILAIGSPDHYNGNGMVRVFEFNWDYGDYVLAGNILYGNQGDGFGTSISISGTDVAVGAPFGGYVQVFSFDPKGGKNIGSSSQKANLKSGFGKFISTTVILGVVGFLMFAVHRNLKRKGFRWSSMASALPGASRIRRRGREAVSTDDNTGRNEWPFPFFSASDRARIEQVRKAEEGRAGQDVDDVDSVVLHGMRRKTGSSSHDAESAESSSSGSDNDSDVSYDGKSETVRQII
jgi:hypothetical protein